MSNRSSLDDYKYDLAGLSNKQDFLFECLKKAEASSTAVYDQVKDFNDEEHKAYVFSIAAIIAVLLYDVETSDELVRVFLSASQWSSGKCTDIQLNDLAMREYENRPYLESQRLYASLHWISKSLSDSEFFENKTVGIGPATLSVRNEGRDDKEISLSLFSSKRFKQPLVNFMMSDFIATMRWSNISKTHDPFRCNVKCHLNEGNRGGSGYNLIGSMHDFRLDDDCHPVLLTAGKKYRLL